MTEIFPSLQAKIKKPSFFLIHNYISLLNLKWGLMSLQPHKTPQMLMISFWTTLIIISSLTKNIKVTLFQQWAICISGVATYSWLFEVHLPVPSSTPSKHELQGWCVCDAFDDCVYIAYVVTLAFPVTFDVLCISHGTGQYLHIRNMW